MLNEPLRCTAITSDQSAWLILWKMTSRRMPALLTRISTRPKASTAALTIASAFFGSVIESVEATASPPAFSMAATVSCAGPSSRPEPVRLAPMSHTTTRAPSAAIACAMARPMPRPPPVTMATLPETMPGILSTPHFLGHFDDQGELRPLLVLRQGVALLGRGEAALRRQAKLLERNIFRRLLDAPLDLVFRLQPPALAGDEAEHDLAVLRHQPQRLERAGARAVVFHEIAVHLDAVEQDFLLGLVAARAHEGRFIVAAAQMHGDAHVGRNVRHRRVDEIAVERPERVRIVAARRHLRAVFFVAQHGDKHLVELQIAAAGVGEGAHGFLVGLAEVVEHLVELRIDLAVDRRARRPAVQRRRRRDRDLGRALAMRGDELEMLEHR